MAKTATYVRERVQREATDKIYFGTFYDPMAARMDFDKIREPSKDGQIDYRKAMESLTVESRRLLRLQVQDFLKWLEAQGAV